MKYLFLNLSIAFNVASYLVYKSISARQHNAVWFVIFAIGLVLGALNVFFFTKALKNIPLSIAYPVFSGACIFIILFVSNLLFGERISTLNVAGTVLVAVGIAFISY